MALTLKYMVESFNSELPWSVCQAHWGPCIDSNLGNITNLIDESTGKLLVKTSAELYFT